MKEKLSIVKIGGNIIEDPKELNTFLSLFAKVQAPKILVHGGGKKASQLLKKMGIQPKMVDGRRITDKATLDVVVMTYAGLTNKTIVAQLQALHCNAIGMSGADANTIKAHKRPLGAIDYGYAGDVDEVDHKIIGKLLKAGLAPVFCALTHNREGQLLNTNADTIAAELAGQLSIHYETILYYCFEKKGVLKSITDEHSVIEQIDSRTYTALLDKGVLTDGMLPKIKNCFTALEKGTSEVRIGNKNLFKKENTNYTTLVL